MGSFAAAWQPLAAVSLHPARQGADQLPARLGAQQLQPGFEILTAVVHVRSKITWFYFYLSQDKKVHYALKTPVTGKYAHHLTFCTLMI